MIGRAYSERDYSCVVWLYWREIIRDDGHDMSVNGEVLETLRTGVDKTQAMCFARGELEL